nr:glycerophosphoryl diester phosphodiesterase membrane domain-containing protein [Solirubrobacterales bacterium]
MIDRPAATGPARPLAVGELLDAAVKLVTRSFLPLVIVTLVVSAPIELIRGVVTAATTDFCRGPGCEDAFGAVTTFTYTDDTAYFSGQAVIIMLSVIQFVVVQIACFRIVAEGYLGRSAGPGESMRFALTRGRSTLWLGLLLVLSLLVGFLLLIVPGVWLAVSFSVAIPVLLVERLGGAQALRRSFDLVKGRWWPTLGRVAAAYLLIAVAAAVIGFLLAIPILLLVEEASYGGLILTGLINLVATVVTTPFLAAVTVLIYFDLRIRKEGFDPALLAERMGGEDATSTVAAPRQGVETDAFGNLGVAPAPAASTSVRSPPSVDWGPPRADPEASRSQTDPGLPGENDAPEPPAPDLGGWAPPRPGGDREP